MRQSYPLALGTLLAFLLLGSANASAQDAKPNHPTKSTHSLETSALTLIESGDSRSPWNLYVNADGGLVKSEVLFSPLENELVWRIQGHTNRLTMLEYLFSSESKSYESLLVLEGPELQRAKRIAAAIERMTAQGHTLKIQLAFAQNGQAHVRELTDLLKEESRQSLDEFFQRTKVNEFGWEGFNLEADESKFPGQESPATLILSLRRSH